MTTQLVHRPARTTQHRDETTPRMIEPPPDLPEGKTGGMAQSLLPVAGVMSSVVMMTVVRGSQYAAIGALLLVVTLFSTVALFLSQRGKANRTRRAQRERYLEYLERLREELAAYEQEQREAARELSPAPEALYDVVRDPARLWERRRTDPDFGRVRIGTGEVPLRPLTLGQHSSSVMTPPDRFMLNEAAALLQRFATASDMPLLVPLDRVGNVSVVGERGAVLRVVRALLANAAVAHAPDDLALGLACPGARLDDWAWLKWLPHTLDAEQLDGPVPARRIAPTLPQLGALLGEDLRERASFAAEARRGMPGSDPLALTGRLLLVSDTHGQVAGELPRPDEAVPLNAMGVTVLHLVEDRLQEPSQVAVRITVHGELGDQVTVEDLRGPEYRVLQGAVDDLSPAAVEGLARMLAPLRLSAESGQSTAQGAGAVDFADLLNLDDPAALDFTRLWASRGERAFLRVPIGVDQGGQPVLLDLKESAELGMGPHGLCVGATGSGKSELLRTLVLALATGHSPEDLSMVLVDYKGGATFAPFTEVPHVAGVITNLENEPGLIERVHTSLAGEVQRRQRVLKDAGNIADISHYRALRETRPDLEPLPHLLVVIDEFGELLTAKPDFIELFLSIGRIGRSIGVHLLLSSQRIEGGKLKGLDTYLSYRLGLRTFSPEESRTVLETPDAFHLPPLPGFGYLKVDVSVYERFKAAFVSGPYRGPARRDTADQTGPLVLPYPAYNTLAAPDAGAEDAQPVLPKRTLGPTTLGVMVDQLRDAAAPVPRIWLPPLPELLTLDRAAGSVQASAQRGLQLAARTGPMQVPLGLLDDPARQWQGRWTVDLTRAGGHAAVIGGPQAGKTTLLRTLVLSLALTHTPAEVGVYGIDLVGGGLQALAELPHVGGIAGRADRERVRRTVDEVRGMLAEREDLFRTHGIDSVAQLRALRAAGRFPELTSTDIILVVDGFGALRDDFEEIDHSITDLLQRGGGYGIHVVAAMLRWNDVRIATQATFGTRIELRLGDPGDSAIERRLAETITPAQHGRALTDARLLAQTALPRFDSLATTAELGAALDQAVRAIRSAWHGPQAQPVRVLPARLPVSSLPGPSAEPDAVPIGLDQTALAPVLLDLFGTDQHLVVLGDDECGKTNLLRLVAQGLMGRHSDEEIVFAVMDPRRGLRGVVPESYNGGYAHNAPLAGNLAAAVTQELEKRQAVAPSATGATSTLWTGPRIVILVDDYDALTAAGQQPLAPFLPFLPSASDIGLHVVLARRVSGAARGLYDPFLLGLRESGTSALVMTGDRSEGELFPGVHATAQPPGRGRLVQRGRPHRLIQTALAPQDATT